MLTVVSWLWRGWRPVYNASHVNIMQAMLNQHLTIPHRLVCVTDMPDGIECETFKLWDAPDGLNKQVARLPNCYRRLFLFSEKARPIFGDKCLSIDLDCLILKNIDSLITDDHFKILRGVINPYNGSIWQVSPGVMPNVWDDLTTTSARAAQKQKAENGKKLYGSDQSFMAWKIPNAPLWDKEDGVYQHSSLAGPVPDNAKIIFYAGSIKPWNSKQAKEYERYARAK